MLLTTRPTSFFFSLAELKYSSVAARERRRVSVGPRKLEHRRRWQLIKPGFYFSPLPAPPLHPSQNTKAPFRAASTSETPTGWSRRRWAGSMSPQSPTTPTASISRTASTRLPATLVRHVWEKLAVRLINRWIDLTEQKCDS